MFVTKETFPAGKCDAAVFPKAEGESFGAMCKKTNWVLRA